MNILSSVSALASSTCRLNRGQIAHVVRLAGCKNCLCCRTLYRCQLTSTFRRDLKNWTVYQSVSLARSWLFLAARAGEHNITFRIIISIIPPGSAPVWVRYFHCSSSHILIRPTYLLTYRQLYFTRLQEKRMTQDCSPVHCLDGTFHKVV